MNQTQVLPNYADLTRILQKTKANCNVSEMHGRMCGMICATSGDNIDVATLFPFVKKSKKAKALLQQMYETSYHELSEFSFEFSLILPTDEVEINTRAENIGLWCQGFLTGLGNIPMEQSPSEVKEALEDMMEIAKINFGDIATNDEDETAYYELVEYVRLSVLMIFHELKKESPIMDDNEGPSIH